jgi:hypothetical protein
MRNLAAEKHFAQRTTSRAMYFRGVAIRTDKMTLQQIHLRDREIELELTDGRNGK